MSDLVRHSDGDKDPKGGKGKALSFAQMGSLLRGTVPAGTSEPSRASEAVYRTACQEVARVVGAVTAATPCDLGPLQRVAASLIESLAHEDGLMIQALEGGDTLLDLPSHLVNVAIFAIKIGQAIGYGHDDLWRLALAACVHDVGMASIPRNILEKPGPLSPEELALIRRHPEAGSRMLQALGQEFDWLATVALHEQEREDGSGYPQGLKGDEIHEYAKIVGLADVYESLTHARPYRRMLAPYDLQQITRDQARAFPNHILHAIANALSQFPAGRRMAETAAAEDPQQAQPESLVSSASTEPLYEEARSEVAKLVEALSSGKTCEADALDAAVTALVESLVSEDGLLVHALAGGGTHLDLPTQMVNVAILAIKIGQGTGYDKEDLRRLALAACVHDVGMVIVPRTILEKPGPLASDEVALIRQHPETGFRMLKTLGPAYEWLATVALHEHEREDGSGYPQGLQGDQIHEYAKIIGLADLYEALTHTRPYQKTRVSFDAVKEIMSADRNKFPNRILRGLIQGLSTFPVGSLVRLNSKEIARVVATNPAYPLRPVVEILKDPRGERLPSPRRVDLAQNSLLYITDTATSGAGRDSGMA